MDSSVDFVVIKSFFKECDLFDISCPVLIKSWDLLKDSAGSIYLKVRFENIEQSAIQAIKGVVSAYNSFGDRLEDPCADFNFIFQDINLACGEGVKDRTISLPWRDARDIKITISQILQNDNRVWSSTQSVYSKILIKKETISGYKLFAGEDAKNLFFLIENGWMCVCGTPNVLSNLVCRHCGRNLEYLQQNYSDRDEVNKKCERAIQKENENNYLYAQNLYIKGLDEEFSNIDEAISALKRLGDYKDSYQLVSKWEFERDTYKLACNYISSKAYDEAIKQFLKIDYFLDCRQRVEHLRVKIENSKRIRKRAIIWVSTLSVLVIGTIVATNVVHNEQISRYKMDYISRALSVAKADGVDDATIDITLEPADPTRTALPTEFYKMTIMSDEFSNMDSVHQFKFIDDLKSIKNLHPIKCIAYDISSKDDYDLHYYVMGGLDFIFKNNDEYYETPTPAPTPTPHVSVQDWLNSQSWITSATEISSNRNISPAADLFESYDDEEISSTATQVTLQELYKEPWAYVGKIVRCDMHVSSIYAHEPNSDSFSTNISNGKSYTDLVGSTIDEIDLGTTVHVFVLYSATDGVNKNDEIGVYGLVVGTDTWQNAVGANITGVTIITDENLVSRK